MKNEILNSASAPPSLSRNRTSTGIIPEEYAGMGLYALTDPDMAREDKFAYVIDPEQIKDDFASGMITKGIFDWIRVRFLNERSALGAADDVFETRTLNQS